MQSCLKINYDFHHSLLDWGTGGVRIIGTILKLLLAHNLSSIRHMAK